MAATGGERVGVVSLLDAKGKLRHSVEIASPVMTMAMSDDKLLLGCRDGAMRVVDYSTETAPAGRRQAASVAWSSHVRLVAAIAVLLAAVLVAAMPMAAAK